jgi:hypothetical protein
MAGASADIVAVTSYDYRHLDDALAAGRSVTTGAYRQAFEQALTGSLAAAAKKQHVVHQFEVLASGIGEMSADRRQAKVLIFGRQLVSDTATKGAQQSSVVTLCATVQRTAQTYLISELSEDANAGVPLGTAELGRAVEAGRAEVVNLLSYSRARFDADLQRALAGAVNPLHDQIQRNAKTVRAALSTGKYDSSGLVSALAVQAARGNQVSLLVAGETSRIKAGGAVSAPTPVRYLVTVTRAATAGTAGGWAVSQVAALAAQ